MRLLVTDYSQDPQLAEAISRYYMLLRMTFTTNIYKVIETPPLAGQPPRMGEVATVEVECGKCKTKTRLQANLGKPSPLQEGAVAFPKNDIFPCPICGAEHNLIYLICADRSKRRQEDLW